MVIKQNVSLKAFNTFGIEAKASSYCDISTIDQLIRVLNGNKMPLFILGGGSNMLLTQNIDALVLHINLKGIEVIKETVDMVSVKVMAGENWHEFVLWCIEHNYGGIENLSLIPGNVGTAPIQNIGAYGVELKDAFISCEAVNTKNLIKKTFSKKDCKFGYRESVFKQELKGQYIITSVNFEFTKHNHKLNVDYGAIKEQLKISKVLKPTIKSISNAVIAIRKSKLPDPADIGNSGSFFKNPVISSNQFEELLTNFPNIPSYKISDKKIKIPAGWLIEKAGFKGKRFDDYGVHNKQALVLVNYGNAKGSDILNLAQLIQQTVLQIFDIKIETEVNII
ncbi:UDP-N-acetylmuramate dehydrogenase [Winogradskyella sp. PE311]|uniref:UDP-N-acetylmuramate dehydrogenase n=1 Tax=Winogradskyella sp. PE311 TaxID=3366943 RepID=UPI0039807354